MIKKKTKKKSSGSFTKGDTRAKEANAKAHEAKAENKRPSANMRNSLDNILTMPVVPKSVTKLMHQMGIEENPENLIDAVNLALVARALSGNIPAIKEINDRIDGRTSLLLEEDETEYSMVFKVRKTGNRAETRKQQAQDKLDGKKKKEAPDKKKKTTKRTTGGKK